MTGHKCEQGHQKKGQATIGQTPGGVGGHRKTVRTFRKRVVKVTPADARRTARVWVEGEARNTPVRKVCPKKGSDIPGPVWGNLLPKRKRVGENKMI